MRGTGACIGWMILAIAGQTVMSATTPIRTSVAWNDSFTDGSRDDGPSPTDGAWYRYNSTQPQFSVTHDDALGGGDALKADFTGTDQTFLGTFDSVSLGSEVGDRLEFRFDFRFAQDPEQSHTGFRWGLFQTTGTQVGEDGSDLTDDDPNYRVVMSTETDNPETLVQRLNPAGSQPLTGGGPVLKDADTAEAGGNQVADEDAHSAGLNLVRTANGVDLEILFEGSRRFTVSDASGSELTRFDYAAFSNSVDDTPLLVDNVKLTDSRAIPEPASLALLGMGGLTLLGRRRRGAPLGL